ncbi:hypothetical protein SNEBB_002064 [Seison nebaliae]|nr:hypothetical protein SNEBB_002064 [Seison nebaliae]
MDTATSKKHFQKFKKDEPSLEEVVTEMQSNVYQRLEELENLKQVMIEKQAEDEVPERETVNILNQLSEKIKEKTGQWEESALTLKRELENKMNKPDITKLQLLIEDELSLIQSALKKQAISQNEDGQIGGTTKQLVRYHCVCCDNPVSVDSNKRFTKVHTATKGFRSRPMRNSYLQYELSMMRDFQRQNRLGTHPMAFERTFLERETTKLRNFDYTAYRRFGDWRKRVMDNTSNLYEIWKKHEVFEAAMKDKSLSPRWRRYLGRNYDCAPRRNVKRPPTFHVPISCKTKLTKNSKGNHVYLQRPKSKDTFDFTNIYGDKMSKLFNDKNGTLEGFGKIPQSRKSKQENEKEKQKDNQVINNIYEPTRPSSQKVMGAESPSLPVESDYGRFQSKTLESDQRSAENIPSMTNKLGCSCKNCECQCEIGKKLQQLKEMNIEETSHLPERERLRKYLEFISRDMRKSHAETQTHVQTLLNMNDVELEDAIENITFCTCQNCTCPCEHLHQKKYKEPEETTSGGEKKFEKVETSQKSGSILTRSSASILSRDATEMNIIQHDITSFQQSPIPMSANFLPSASSYYNSEISIPRKLKSASTLDDYDDAMVDSENIKLVFNKASVMDNETTEYIKSTSDEDRNLDSPLIELHHHRTQTNLSIAPDDNDLNTLTLEDEPDGVGLERKVSRDNRNVFTSELNLSQSDEEGDLFVDENEEQKEIVEEPVTNDFNDKPVDDKSMDEKPVDDKSVEDKPVDEEIQKDDNENHDDFTAGGEAEGDDQSFNKYPKHDRASEIHITKNKKELMEIESTEITSSKISDEPTSEGRPKYTGNDIIPSTQETFSSQQATNKQEKVSNNSAQTDEISTDVSQTNNNIQSEKDKTETPTNDHQNDKMHFAEMKTSSIGFISQDVQDSTQKDITVIKSQEMKLDMANDATEYGQRVAFAKGLELPKNLVNHIKFINPDSDSNATKIYPDQYGKHRTERGSDEDIMFIDELEMARHKANLSNRHFDHYMKNWPDYVGNGTRAKHIKPPHMMEEKKFRKANAGGSFYQPPVQIKGMPFSIANLPNDNDGSTKRVVDTCIDGNNVPNVSVNGAMNKNTAINTNMDGGKDNKKKQFSDEKNSGKRLPAHLVDASNNYEIGLSANYWQNAIPKPIHRKKYR